MNGNTYIERRLYYILVWRTPPPKKFWTFFDPYFIYFCFQKWHLFQLSWLVLIKMLRFILHFFSLWKLFKFCSTKVLQCLFTSVNCSSIHALLNKTILVSFESSEFSFFEICHASHSLQTMGYCSNIVLQFLIILVKRLSEWVINMSNLVQAL